MLTIRLNSGQRLSTLCKAAGGSSSEIARDLGISVSMLSKYVAALKVAGLLPGPHLDPAKELARLRRENELLRQEREQPTAQALLTAVLH